MIRVVKPADAPAILRDPQKRGPIETDALQEAFDNGETDFAFKSSVYGHKTVKNALIRAQHDKCCFCESKIKHIAYGDVEHFRPKGGTRQEPDDPLDQPGYYRLAYNWRNLFLSCQICNQRFKRNLFPLVDPDMRARSHHNDIGDEDPLFIDPSVDPESHIGFREEHAFAISGSAKGKETIAALGLNRPEVEEMRRGKLVPAKLLQDAARSLVERMAEVGELEEHELGLLANIEAQLEASRLDSAEYAGMMRAALGS